ncbi:glycosyltransferase family 2 protein [uncultured Photobacterium sp.]|uniref:glycosyltransferase family 2 protein n=1 Tax=uncultured Photobacterium sp. TaxID=173973 RepID=UPI00261D66B4|nr:glycosyltransferase family 2 protein [uncultured Photobacterium sp.]
MEEIQSVSVVIPNYNCLQTLPRAIESVRIQGGNTEIIVVDDGSTDGSREWLEKQGDIKLICSQRMGASKARNLAIHHCSHELVAFLDADDYWMKGKLAQQLALHQVHPEVVFSFSDYMHVSDTGESIIGCFDFWPRFNALMEKQQRLSVLTNFLPILFAENVVGTSTVIVKKQMLIATEGFDSNLRSASDWDLWLRVAVQGPVGVIKANLCHYTSDRAGAISRDHEKRLQAMRQILNKHSRAVKYNPLALLAGYLRWITGKAEYNRIRKAYLTSMCQELFVCCFQPDWRRVKAAGSDILKMMSIK